MRAEIASDRVTYPVLSQSMYPGAYAHLYEIRDSILASGAVYHADDFEWELQIIHDDETLSAPAPVATSMSTLVWSISWLTKTTRWRDWTRKACRPPSLHTATYTGFRTQCTGYFDRR